MPRNKYQRFTDIVDGIVEEIIRIPKDKGGKSRIVNGERLKALKLSVEKLIRDSVAIRHNRSRKSLASIRKGRDSYLPSRYNKCLTYRIHVERAYNGMICLGYIDEVIKGASNRIYGKYLTRYKATNKLIKKFTEDERKVLPVLIKPEEKTELVRIQVTEKVEQGEGKRPAIIKRLLEYSDNEKTNQMRKNLEKINKVLSWHWFDLDLEDNEFDAMQEELKSDQNKERGSDPQVNLANRSLYRVFTDTSFTRGGRFYGGWWQQIPSEYRGRILINGKKTVEFDYGGLHPNILYAEVGIEMSGDAYNGILPLKYRTLVKKAFNAMLNAKHVLTRPPRDLPLRETGWTWTRLSEAIIEKHQPIQHYFYSDTGTRLQFIDSQLAESIMLKFIDNQDPILPVHDSFLVHNGYESALEQYMRDFFKERFNREIDVNKQIKMEKPLPEFDPDNPFGDFVTKDLRILLAALEVGHERRLEKFRAL